MTDVRGEPSARQGGLTPIYIVQRDDGSHAVVARDAAGVLFIEPLIVAPDPPRRTLIACPCCSRSLIWSEFPDGTATLESFVYDPVTLAPIYRDEIEDGDGGGRP
jgi:hypothetical protein